MSVTWNAVGSDKSLKDITDVIACAERGEYYWGTASNGNKSVPAGNNDWSVSGRTISVNESGIFLVIIQAYAMLTNGTKGRVGFRLTGDDSRVMQGLLGYAAAAGGTTFTSSCLLHLTADTNYTVQYFNSTDVAWATGNDATVQKIMAFPIKLD